MRRNDQQHECQSRCRLPHGLGSYRRKEGRSEPQQVVMCCGRESQRLEPQMAELNRHRLLLSLMSSDVLWSSATRHRRHLVPSAPCCRPLPVLSSQPDLKERVHIVSVICVPNAISLSSIPMFSQIVASVFSPSARVITAKPFQPMVNL